MIVMFCSDEVSMLSVAGVITAISGRALYVDVSNQTRYVSSQEMSYQAITATTARAGAVVHSSQVVKSHAVCDTPKSELIPSIVIDLDLNVRQSICVYAIPTAADNNALTRKAIPVPIRRNHSCWF